MSHKQYRSGEDRWIHHEPQGERRYRWAGERNDESRVEDRRYFPERERYRYTIDAPHMRGYDAAGYAEETGYRPSRNSAQGENSRAPFRGQRERGYSDWRFEHDRDDRRWGRDEQDGPDYDVQRYGEDDWRAAGAQDYPGPLDESTRPTNVRSHYGSADQQSWRAAGAQDYPSLDEATRTSFRGRGPKGYQRSDERLKELICDQLTDDPEIDASDIEVDVRNGEVFLQGRVSDRHTKYRVEDVIANCGAREVHNQLRVQRSPEAL